MHFRKIVSFAMIFALGITFSFASNNSKGFEVGNLSSQSGDSKDSLAIKFIEKKLEKGEFKIKNKYTDEFGLTTVRIQQYYNGFPIFGHDQIVNIQSDGVIKLRLR